MSSTDTVLSMIEREALKSSPEDSADFMVDDYAGGNIDDAFEIGVRAGRIAFARELLAEKNG